MVMPVVLKAQKKEFENWYLLTVISWICLTNVDAFASEAVH